MIKNKLKINDSKTEFIVFRSPQAKQDLSGLSVSVGDSVAQSSKVLHSTCYANQVYNDARIVTIRIL